MNPSRRSLLVLLAGDMVVVALVTVVGFATHGELDSSGARLLTTFIPVLAAWLCSAPFLGAYDVQKAADIRQVWRPFWAMILAGPLAAWLRSVMRGSPAIITIFVFVLTGVSALSILAWRALYALVVSRKG